MPKASENKKKILRFLFHNRGDYKKRREIQDGTGLTRTQFDYVIDDLVGKYVDCPQKDEDDEDDEDEEEEEDEDEEEEEFPVAYEYHINSDGRAYVRDNIDEIPQEQKNREEIEKQGKQIMLLRSSINEMKDNVTEHMEWNELWNDKAQKRFEAIEERLDRIEDELGIEYDD